MMIFRLVKTILTVIITLISINVFSTCENHFFVISDIHFNPFASCSKENNKCALIQQLVQAPYTQWNKTFMHSIDQKNNSNLPEGTNYQILVSRLNHLKNQHPKPSYVLVLGDFLSHSFRSMYKKYTGDQSLKYYDQFVNKTFMFLAEQLKQTFPDVPIYPVMGNHDSYRRDYYSHPNGKLYKFLTKDSAWGQFFIDKYNKAHFRKIFSYAGYYDVSLPNAGNNKLIVLNTVLFSSYAIGDQQNIQLATTKELNWFANQLKKAQEKKYRVLIILHIPDGIDLYNTMKNNTQQVVTLWRPDSRVRFQELLRSYSSVISAILAGHLHMDGFILNRPDEKTIVPLMLIPSFLPAFGHDAGYKNYTYCPNLLSLEDFKVSYFDPIVDNPHWAEAYDLNDSYTKYCKNCIDALMQQGRLANQFRYHYAMNLYKKVNMKNIKWPYVWCAVNHSEVKPFLLCLKKTNVAN